MNAIRYFLLCAALLVGSGAAVAQPDPPRLFSLPHKNHTVPFTATDAQRYNAQYREVVEYLLRSYNDYERVEYLLKQSPPLMETEAARDEAIHKLIAKLQDRWTVYRSPDELLKANRRYMAGDVSFGITLDHDKDGYFVSYVSGASAAYRAGLKRGDRILAIDGWPIGELTQETVNSWLLAQPGEVTVTLKVKDAEVEVPLTLTKASDRIVTSSEIEGTWYFHIQNFSSDKVLTEFAEAARALNNANANPKGIILDLRGNHGGYMDFAYQFVSAFLKEGKIGEHWTRSGRLTLKTRMEVEPFSPTYLRPTAANKRLVSTLQQAPLVVLVDGSTISAGEMVASALKGSKRGLLLGTTTWGKGVSFHYINLNSGGQLQICTGVFYGPDGFDHRNRGVAPTMVVERTHGADDNQLKAGLEAIAIAKQNMDQPKALARSNNHQIWLGLGIVTVFAVATALTAIGLHRVSRKRHHRPSANDDRLDQQFALWVKEVQPEAEPPVAVVQEGEAAAVVHEGEIGTDPLTLSRDHFMVGAPCETCKRPFAAGETVLEVITLTTTYLYCQRCRPLQEEEDCT
ncbi:MAG: PDZ domain-containing protein [Candidatus Obscuribacterales bacterium]|nr:PDZ domain-containing protein [Candidatus Obscuribacterales bacterium]